MKVAAEITSILQCLFVISLLKKKFNNINISIDFIKSQKILSLF